MIFLHPALVDGAYTMNVPAETARAQPADSALRPPLADPAWGALAQAASEPDTQGNTASPGSQTAPGATPSPATTGSDITIPYVPDTSGAGTPGSMDNNSGAAPQPQATPPATPNPSPSPSGNPSSNPSTNPGGDTNNPGSPH